MVSPTPLSNQLEDDLKKNGRKPPKKTEDDLQKRNGRQPGKKMEDDLKNNGRRPKTNGR